MLTSKDMEKQIKVIPTLFINFKFPPVEYGKDVWKGISAYSEMRKEQPHLIPTEKEFVRKFVGKTIGLFPAEKLMTQYDKYKLGLECRARRAYKSLVREEHCIQRMREIYPESGVLVSYGEEDDWREGVDVTLIDTVLRRKHSVHLFVDTPAAWRARRHKATRGQGRNFENHVDLPFAWKHGKKVGDFYLYSDNQLFDFLYRLRTDYKHKGVEWDGTVAG
jgi:hypothetical protein